MTVRCLCKCPGCCAGSAKAGANSRPAEKMSLWAPCRFATFKLKKYASPTVKFDDVYFTYSRPPAKYWPAWVWQGIQAYPLSLCRHLHPLCHLCDFLTHLHCFFFFCIFLNRFFFPSQYFVCRHRWIYSPGQRLLARGAGPYAQWTFWQVWSDRQGKQDLGAAVTLFQAFKVLWSIQIQDSEALLSFVQLNVCVTLCGLKQQITITSSKWQIRECTVTCVQCTMKYK